MSGDRNVVCPTCGEESFSQDGFETLTIREIVAHFQCEKCHQTFCVRGKVLEVEAT